MGATIIGVGKALPALEIENDELKKLVDTNDEWISSRTGISSRHISVDESAQALAYSAACSALGIKNELHQDIYSNGFTYEKIDPSSIDLVVYATVTSDTIVPSSAATLKRRLGLENAIAFDINAACTGFIYGATVAESMMAVSQLSKNNKSRSSIKRALVLGVDRLSRITDWQDRNTCVLFGDGAGAAVLEWKDDESGIISSYLKNDDDNDNVLTCPQSYESTQPFVSDGALCWEEAGLIPEGIAVDAAAPHIDKAMGITERLEKGAPRQVIRMEGQAVFKFASRAMSDAINKVLDRAGLTLSDIDCIVPHQANERIIKFAAKRLDVSTDLFQLSINHNGNTSSASVPMALTDAYASGRIHKGNKVVIVAFGGGLTSGAILFEA